MRLTKIYENFAAHDDGIWSTAWLADRDCFASASVDESVKVWEAVEPQASSAQPGYASQHTYTGHTLGVISVAADSTGKFLASSALDSIVRVWNAQTNQDCGVSVSAPTEVWAIAFGPTQDDNPTLAIAAGTRAGITFQACNPSRQQEDGDSLSLIEKATYQLPQVTGRG
jgi:WD repeat-containing protein 61